MTLPPIYEDAINCFCPRTAWEMRRLVEKYLLNGERPIGLTRFGKAPAAMLRLILMNIDLIDQSDRSIKSIDQVEEEIKRRNRDGKNIVSLSPGPSIIDTRKGEKREEKSMAKEEFFIAREKNNNNSAREEKILHSNEILHPNENEENSNENENDRKGLNPLAARGAEDPTGKIAAARAEEEKITNPAHNLHFSRCLSLPTRGTPRLYEIHLGGGNTPQSLSVKGSVASK